MCELRSSVQASVQDQGPKHSQGPCKHRAEMHPDAHGTPKGFANINPVHLHKTLQRICYYDLNSTGPETRPREVKLSTVIETSQVPPILPLFQLSQ